MRACCEVSRELSDVRACCEVSRELSDVRARCEVSRELADARACCEVSRELWRRDFPWKGRCCPFSTSHAICYIVILFFYFLISYVISTPLLYSYQVNSLHFPPQACFYCFCAFIFSFPLLLLQIVIKQLLCVRHCLGIQRGKQGLSLPDTQSNGAERSVNK